MEIKCDKTDCKHNTGCSCKANTVVVDRSEQCESYINEPIKSDLIEKNGNIFGVAENKVAKHLRNVPLECKAKDCVYNREKRCQADGISVINGENCADCATFCECCR